MSESQLLAATDKLQQYHSRSKLRTTKIEIKIPANTPNLNALATGIIEESSSKLQIHPTRRNLVAMLNHTQKSKPTAVIVIRGQLNDEYACWAEIEGQPFDSDSDTSFFVGCLTVPSKSSDIILAATHEILYTICVEREHDNVEYHFSDAYFGQLTLLSKPQISLLLTARSDEDGTVVKLCFTQQLDEYCGYYEDIIGMVRAAEQSHPQHPSVASSHAAGRSVSTASGVGERSKKRISPTPAAKRNSSAPSTDKKGFKKSAASKPVAVPVSRSLVHANPEPRVRLGETAALIRRAQTIARVARLTHFSSKPTAYALYRKKNAGKSNVVPWKKLLPETRRKFEHERVRAQELSNKKQRIRASAGFQEFVAAYLLKQDNEFTGRGTFGKMLQKLEKEGGRGKITE